ncbi:MAG TPA: phasin family protein [Bradyrhizobium sp.]|nr:phasin family protein [Bradyrhizobium sp.]
MSDGSGAQHSELRDLAHHNIGQLNRAVVGWFELARRTLDAAEANVTALCNHASQLAHAETPAECVRLQAEFVKSSIASMQKQSMEMLRAGKEAAE